jgi:hypothetical protein
MLFKEYDRIEISNIVGFKESKALFNRWNIVRPSTIPTFYGLTDYFTSAARYKPYVVDYIENHGKIGGFDGATWLDWIIIDVDEHSPAKIKLFLQHLSVNHEIPIDYNRIYFSGNKGFHVQIPSILFGLKPAKRLHEVVRKIVERIADKIVPYDPSLYDKTQVYRLVHTKHSSSGLYKTPIDYSELDFNIDRIKDIARAQRIDFNYPYYPEDSQDDLVEMAKECTQELSNPIRTKSLSLGNGNGIDDFSEAPKWRKLCVYNMLKGSAEGNRNDTAFRLAAHFRKEGYAIDVVAGILHGWNVHNSPHLSDTEISSCVTSAFQSKSDYGCHDQILKNNCNIDCYLFRR